MNVTGITVICGGLLLSACGAEVATTAVTATKLQAAQAQQAQAQADQIKKNLDGALRSAEAAASAAGEK